MEEQKYQISKKGQELVDSNLQSEAAKVEKKGAEAEKKNVEIDLQEARNLRALVERKYEKLKREHKKVTEQL